MRTRTQLVALGESGRRAYVLPSRGGAEEASVQNGVCSRLGSARKVGRILEGRSLVDAFSWVLEPARRTAIAYPKIHTYIHAPLRGARGYMAASPSKSTERSPARVPLLRSCGGGAHHSQNGGRSWWRRACLSVGDNGGLLMRFLG